MSTLDELFAEVARYGRISVHRAEQGYWSCRINLTTNTPGVMAEVHTHYAVNCQTPHAAIQNALDQLGNPPIEGKKSFINKVLERIA